MIKEVQKVKIIVPKDNKEDLFLALQKEAIVMLPKHIENSMIDITTEEEIVSRADIAIKKLSGHIQKNRKFFNSNEVDFEEFTTHYDDRVVILEKIENSFDQLNFLSKENSDIQLLIDEVINYKDLKYSTNELFKSVYTSFHFGYLPENRWDMFNSYCQNDSISYTIYNQNELGHHILVYLDKDDVDTKHNNLKRFGFVEVELPLLDEKFKSYIADNSKKILENTKEIKKIETELANANKEELELKILVDQAAAKIERKLIIYKEDDKDVFLDGWISSDKTSELQKVVRKVTLGYQLEFDAANEFDEVPTLLENKKILKPFESIMNTFSVPNYNEIDPTPVMSFWYWIIFGLMMGDIGYGLMMIVLFGLFIKLKNPKGEFGSLVRVFFYSGITTVIAGILYGSFFGADFDLLKIIGNLFGQNWTSVVVNPVNDPMKMLIFSIGLGILHLSSGLVMKVRLSIKQKDYIEGISKGLSWLLILIGIAIFAMTLALGLPKAFQTIALITIIVGVGLMIVFGGMKKKSILGKIFGGIAGLGSITSYLSDILSYSRILALALSTAIIASTMNLLAGLMQGSPFTFIFAILIYIGGHIFTFVMGMLSSYVHSNRLEYLEFFGKFYQGGGYLFEPLQFNTKYINQITFKEE